MAGTVAPNIVTDGLVLYLDAANVKSYPGSGTVWRDIVGTNNGTLINGPTFDSGNGGSIVFDGVNDYVTVPNVINFGVGFTGTVEVISNNISGSLLYNERTSSAGWNGYFEITGNGNLAVGANTRNISPFVYFMTTSTSRNINSINHYIASYQIPSVTGTMDGILGINGIFENISNPNMIVNISNGNFRTLEIGRQRNASFGTSYTPGTTFLVRIYNRRLNINEMLQNYNATKTRFGL